MMRDCLNNRGGLDRVLMAVAATFLTVSATSALAQGDQPHGSAAELAIDAAIPLPEPANVPPPTAADFKLDTTTAAPASTEAKPAEAATPSTALAPSVPLPSAPIPAPTASSSASPTPGETAAAPAATAAAPAQPAASETATTPAATATAPLAEPATKVSNVPPADQPVADRLKDLLAGKSVRFFDRKAERAAVEKFYGAREYAPLWPR